MRKLKEKDLERFAKLEKLAGSRNEIYDLQISSLTLLERRNFLAKKISEIIEEIPNQRLMTIISESMKYLKIMNKLPIEYDLLKAKPKEVKKSEEFVKYFDKYIETSEDSHINTVCFNPEGSAIITGSNDGFIEI